jgi:Flp pilus assembly protein TadD
MVIASISIGAFVALERVLTAPAVSAQMQELSTRAMTLTAAMPTQASSTIGRAGERAPEKILPATEPEIPGAIEEITASAVAATPGNEVAVAVMPEPAVKDAKYYLERGDAAYRSGDFPLALTDFDLAINLDPNSSDAYVNRAIVFRRMGELKRAFADVAQARRIDEGERQ